MTYAPKLTGEEVVVGVAGENAVRFLQEGGMFALHMVGVKKRVKGRDVHCAEVPWRRRQCCLTLEPQESSTSVST